MRDRGFTPAQLATFAGKGGLSKADVWSITREQGTCDTCGNLAPKGKRFCRRCVRLYPPFGIKPPTLPNLVLENPS